MKDKYLGLIEQIIEQAERDDQKLKEYYLLKNKASKSEGDGFVLFYLRVLRDMIQDNDS